MASRGSLQPSRPMQPQPAPCAMSATERCCCALAAHRSTATAAPSRCRWPCPWRRSPSNPTACSDPHDADASPKPAARRLPGPARFPRQRPLPCSLQGSVDRHTGRACSRRSPTRVASTRASMLIRILAIAAAPLLAASACAAEPVARLSPLRLHYVSAFAGGPTHADAQPVEWARSNALVGELQGHAGHWRTAPADRRPSPSPSPSPPLSTGARP